MYARKQTRFSWSNYWVFLKNRWRRIAPAFYAAALACAVGQAVAGKPFPWGDLLAHATFSHLLFLPLGTNGLAPPFWSLATEWHFYLLLPLFIWVCARWGFWPSLAAASAASMGLRLWMFTRPEEVASLWNGQVPMRFVEFAAGMGAAWLYIANRTLPQLLRGWHGFLLGFGVAYAGRLLMVTEVVRLAGGVGPLLKALAEPVLTLGYALMLWNILLSPSPFQKFLEHPLAQSLGRLSYSIYLWHWFPCVWASQVLVARLGSSPLTQYAALALSLCIVIPVSYLSYAWLEAPYFKSRLPHGTGAPQAPAPAASAPL